MNPFVSGVTQQLLFSKVSPGVFYHFVSSNASELSPMELSWTVVLVLLHGVCVVWAYPSGAPASACEDMIPRHMGVQPQPSPAPYSLLTDSKTYQPGSPVTVTVVGPEYRGVLLEARTSGSTNALGTWQLLPPDTRFQECSGNPQGAVTHANTNVKGNATVYSWIASDTKTPVFFVATVAEQRTVFWLKVRSATLTRGPSSGLGLATGAGPELASGRTLLLGLICCIMLKLLG